jgi:hypothetical protein
MTIPEHLTLQLEYGSVLRLGLGQPTPRLNHIGEGMASGQGVGMLITKHPPANLQHSTILSLRIVLASGFKQVSQVVPRGERVDVVIAEHPPAKLQDNTKLSLGLRELALTSQDGCTGMARGQSSGVLLPKYPPAVVEHGAVLGL